MNMQPALAEKSRRHIELDFIRGLAILLVLDFHAPHHILLKPFELLGIPNFGWCGVSLFFVLSGFLVGGLLIEEWQTRGAIDARRFLVRRGLKIWPQYYCFVALALLSGHHSLTMMRGNLLNLQNYLGGVPHTWTLAVEEHAYLLLALLLPLAVRRQITVRSVALIALSGAVAVILWQLALGSLGGNIFERTDTRVDGILFGVALAALLHARPATFRRLQRARLAWWLCLVAGVAAFRLQASSWQRVSLRFVAADLLGVAALMLLYAPERRAHPRPMLYRVVAAIGVYSYGIYLWHVSVISVSLGLVKCLPAFGQPIWRAALPPVAGILAGVIATRLIESPMLLLRERFFPRVTAPRHVTEQVTVDTMAHSVLTPLSNGLTAPQPLQHG